MNQRTPSPGRRGMFRRKRTEKDRRRRVGTPSSSLRPLHCYPYESSIFTKLFNLLSSRQLSELIDIGVARVQQGRDQPSAPFGHLVAMRTWDLAQQSVSTAVICLPNLFKKDAGTPFGAVCIFVCITPTITTRKGLLRLVGPPTEDNAPEEGVALSRGIMRGSSPFGCGSAALWSFAAKPPVCMSFQDRKSVV